MENQQLTGIMITLNLYYSDGDTVSVFNSVPELSSTERMEAPPCGHSQFFNITT